jgi:hypothetical protein
MRLFICLFTISLNLYSSEKVLICPLFYLNSVQKKVESSGQYDKFKHCGVSCLLTLRCPSTDVFELGVLKEIIDIAGPGNAELADLEADLKGIKIAHKKKMTDSKCLIECHLSFPEKLCR